MKASTAPSTVCMVCFFLIGIVVLAQNEKSPAERWIKDLASEEFKVRENASQELWGMGEKALPILREAELSDDPEVAMRAKVAAEKIELGISPDTPQKILALIDAYRKGSSNEKLNILRELREEKAYFQLLKLYSMEDEQDRKGLNTAVQDVAVTAAREAILVGDEEKAIQILRLMPDGYDELLALACLYRGLGQLDAQIVKSDPPKGIEPAEWKVFLLRAKGDLDELIAHAAETRQSSLLAALKVLKGDPVSWMETNPLVRPQIARSNKTYTDLALKRWNGNLLDDNDMEPLLKLLQSNNRFSQMQGIYGLSALGFVEPVYEMQRKENPFATIDQHLTREEHDQTLEALGFKPGQKDYAQWAADQFNEILKGEYSDMVLIKLRLFASYMERMGLDQELDEAFSKHLDLLQAKDQEEYLHVVSQFMNSQMGASHFAADHMSRWAAQDEERWASVYAAALGEEDAVMEWLLWIRKISPEIKDRQALDVMLAIFHRSSKPGNLREVWMNRIWKAVESEQNKEQKDKYIRQILSLSIMLQDVVNALRAWDLLDAAGREAAQWGSMDMYLSAAGRWKDAADLLMRNMEREMPSSPELHAHYAATLRRAGMEKKASEHDEWVEKLALGSSSLSVGGYYAYAGDSDRADLWYRRAAMETQISNPMFAQVLEIFAHQNLRNRDWQVAASSYEALLHVKVGQQHNENSISDLAKIRMKADLARAISLLPTDKAKSLKMLHEIHQKFLPDAILADDFFPALRDAGLKNELQAWFSASWDYMEAVIKKNPKSHNSRNSAAWMASRARLKVDEAEKYLLEAIRMSPDQAAYLDTMAEIKFAQGDRKAALEWSQRSLCHAPFDEMIRLQHERFRREPMPVN